MGKIRSKTEPIRCFILEHVSENPSTISRLTMEKYGLTRQAINKHLRQLVEENYLIQSGNTRNKIYKLAPILKWEKNYQITPELAEDVIWRADIQPLLGKMANNVMQIWHYGFTEMFNNVIDHSASDVIEVQIIKTAINTEMIISDTGIGIFKKIQNTLNLLDERHALLELSKGKLTTDPARHSGEGIFFTSRMFDSYGILSGETYFSHSFNHQEDWILETNPFSEGTVIWMKLNNHTARTTKEVFDQFTTDQNYGFNKTVVPVKLAQYGNESLISRSQAKRLLARIELFKKVIFNFEDVDSIGQAFADEIFRVFRNQHPSIELITINANTEVMQMINRANSL